ncbi:MAG: alpha-amylase family glycosyl hydrolase [Paludibacteraceae bacterium]|nr:alpha-amylase family glycosyl hydrolase [Paludibacteraceae bacterium]
MNKSIFCVLCALSLLAIVAVSCTKHTTEQPSRHPAFAYDATIYELNTRQFTPEGTFNAAAEHLGELKELGVDIIWMMPLQIIGEKERKGTLGSYYAIKDYCVVNPEFGTIDDLKAFIQQAHEMGFKVILDWVANHTSPDSEWTKNDGWHYRDSLGNLMVQYDWTDISKLNYDNQDMRAAMLKAMHYWIDEVNFDGFRCDVAGEVPTDFWNWAMGDIRTTHPDLFTLAENEDKAQELTESAFDMYYGWELHAHMNKVAQGIEKVSDLWAYFEKCDSTLRPEAIRMNFTSNHDENTWAGTEFERMGEEGSKAFAAFCYVVPGMPLIYTGQEYALDHRLEFFEKDQFERRDVPQMQMYKNLNAFRKANPALQSNEKGAPMHRIACDNEAIFACSRQLEGNIVLGIFNFSDAEQTVHLETTGFEGEYTCPCGKQFTIEAAQTLTLQPWQCMVMGK